MARIESRALGGYYPYPTELLEATANLLHIEGDELTIVDPCAGEGEAVRYLYDAWQYARRVVRVYTCELEKERHAKLKSRFDDSWRTRGDALHGDAFRIRWQGEYDKDTGFANVLFLNPPYDNPRGKRLELSFLERFTSVLIRGSGILMFVIPDYVLTLCADYLARHYVDIAWYRFPEPHYQAYKQITVIARRAKTPIGDTEDIRNHPQYQAMMNPSECPVLGGFEMQPVTLRCERAYHNRWSMQRADIAGLVAYGRAGVQTLKSDIPSRTLGFDRPVTELLAAPVNPVLMPPRPGHIAQAMAMGLFNGIPVQPDKSDSGLPTIIVKGVFTRDRITVSEKKAKDGSVKGVVEVEKPQLRLTILDIGNGELHRVAAGVEPTGATELSRMNAADILANYGRGLGDILVRQCPVLHHPAHHDPIPLPPVTRAPYTFQHHAMSAAIKSLLTLGENPPILGEVGVGKTTIALQTAWCLAPQNYRTSTQGIDVQYPITPVRNVLVLCPPHLLTTWADEARTNLPGANVRIVQNVSDLNAIEPQDTDLPGNGMAIYVLSRETAKLGHAIVGVSDICPRCGGALEDDASVNAEKRKRCTHEPVVIGNAFGQLLARWGKLVMPALGIKSRLNTARIANSKPNPDRWLQVAGGSAYRELLSDTRAMLRDEKSSEVLAMFLCRMIAAIPDEVVRDQEIIKTLEVFDALYRPKNGYDDTTIREMMATLALCLSDAAERLSVWDTFVKVWIARVPRAGIYSTGVTVKDYQEKYQRAHDAIENGTVHSAYSNYHIGRTKTGTIAVNFGSFSDNPMEIGATVNVSQAFRDALPSGEFSRGEACNEPLFQSIPQPRRYPLAKYILRYRRDLFDMLIIDEAHEYANDGSAQEKSAHRLVELGLPTLWMSGSISDGFASGLFANLWSLSRSFRTEWGRDRLAAFTRRYGYRKFYREFDEGGNEKDLARRHFGAVTDRESDGGTSRALGESPGVMPHAILRHILPTAVIIHKSDLDTVIPPMTEEHIPIAIEDADVDLLNNEAILRGDIVRQIVEDRYSPGMSGRLFGALGQVPFYLDRATLDTGNLSGDHWIARYPEECGGAAVASVPLLPSERILPKEAWLYAFVKSELDAGRNVLIGVVNTGKGMGLVERLARLLSDLAPSAILDTNKVSASKRKDWITAEVVNKKRRILFVNPAAVQTGLNNLVWFSTLVLYQVPPGQAKLYRQVIGRVHRPGQKQNVKVVLPYYVDTTQGVAIDHLARKVSASLQVDGLDIQSALESTGAGVADALDVMGLGEMIYQQITSGNLKRKAVTPVTIAAPTIAPKPKTETLVQETLFAAD